MMVDKFMQYVQDQQLFFRRDKILLAISGGIDSVAMLQCFKQAGIFTFGVAHCNFGLRGEDSDNDERFVERLAKKARVPFYSTFFETKAFADQEKISIQMAARSLRYAWFQSLLADHGYDYIATAHHSNDVLETALFNLAKGTGIAGLSGISNKSGKIVRPLLFADKALIHDYVGTHQLAWREDSSNESVKYARNLIRHEVIPVLKKINPDLENTFQSTVDRLAQVEAVLKDSVNRIAKMAVEKKGQDTFIALEVLRKEKTQPVTLHELIKPFGFNYTQSKEVHASLAGGAGKIFETPTHQLNIDREYLIISERNINDFIPDTIGHKQAGYHNKWLDLKLNTIANNNFAIPDSNKVAALDFDKLKFPLYIRKWQKGDYFFPLGMKRKKKLSDFMIDEKIPLNLKQRVFLLTSGEDIVWVIGHRIDDRFKISVETRTIFKAEIVNDKSF